MTHETGSVTPSALLALGLLVTSKAHGGDRMSNPQVCLQAGRKQQQQSTYGVYSPRSPSGFAETNKQRNTFSLNDSYGLEVGP